MNENAEGAVVLRECVGTPRVRVSVAEPALSE